MKRAIAWCLLVLAGSALAQLNDPTRPPGGMDAATGTALPDGGPESGLSAVFLRPGKKPAALVNGVYVVQGGKLGDKRVLKISDAEVVLRNPDGSREVMRLVPGVRTTPAIRKKIKVESAAGSAQGSEGK